MILVDTHVVLWLAFDQEQISSKARAAIDDARGNADGLAISNITLLELATLASKGRVRLDTLQSASHDLVTVARPAQGSRELPHLP